MTTDLAGPLRAICLALPEVTERPSHGAPPGRFFRPPYVGGRGWIGVRLDAGLDWAEIAELCQDAYRAVAPARLVTLLDAG